ncbi:MAG: hypothetical protein DWQ31_16845 [Planctomycetota bacterium]|nr:MAG: hypothetical protein DWQ31_16845 [Planctomycetota bacterium]REJ92022.1 MAG: hypothetical protein DWQ35_12795 [Planctomycetota bacterium]REK28558.1 MAG: hypothetical protein DWQ42_04385 [Planctomycetota bacterium]REK39173.1 MAG: hypothetical protein DWQ46_17970 [Planctomycetota bacterium]
MSKVYIDSETCGLHSMMVLLQYAEEDGLIHLVDIWKQPVGKTLQLIEWLCENTIVGFNLVFDWFHIVKIYTIFRLCPTDWIPEEHIEEIAQLEPQGQDGPCVKPANALDLLLHSRKGPYQSLMARSDVRIRRVPTALAYALAEELEQRVKIDGIYFAKSHDKDAPRWQVFDIKGRDGEILEDFKDVVLKFNPAGGLKFLAEHALGYKPKYHYRDVEPDPAWYPKEIGFAPTALALSKPEKSWEVWKRDKQTGKRSLAGYAWPGVIEKFIDHWSTRQDARDYARDDIVYTRALDGHFGFPEPGDDDSLLACMVPVVRWRGFKIDNRGMKTLLAEAREVVAKSPVNVNKPDEVRAYLYQCMDEMEQEGPIATSTKKANLEAIARWKVTEDEECLKCGGEDPACPRCDGSGILKPGAYIPDDTGQFGNHPAAWRAKEILDVKTAAKEVELYRKLLRAGKFHASFNVIGTLSTRMSGGDGLNAQGIKAADEVRRMFPLAWDGYLLGGGDFDSFEVTLADAVYDDPNLRKALLSGKKIHALFAMELFPGTTYEQVMANKKMYGAGKSGIFAMVYGGDWRTLMRNLGIAEEVAKAAYENFIKKYPGVEKARQATFKKFCSMTQPGGIGTMVVWRDPADYVESFLGFRRYFTLENQITKELFNLARKPPKGWRAAKIKCQRARDGRIQTVGGAVASALYGAAFGIQAANMRAAANHEIQSPGGQITKQVQRRIWDLQPAGVHELLVAPMNVHDELMTVSHPSMAEPVVEVVRDTVESFRDRVPLIGMTWFKEMDNWAEKKGGAEPVKIRCPEMMAA